MLSLPKHLGRFVELFIINVNLSVIYKMRNRKIIFIVFFSFLCGWIYNEYFSKSSHVFAKMNEVKTGMSREQVVKILSKPDTIYVWPGNDSVWVMHYDMGLTAPDAVRVFIEHDTVSGVRYNQ